MHLTLTACDLLLSRALCSITGAWIAHWIVGTDPVTKTRFSLGFVLELSSELMLFSSLVLAGNNLLNFSLVKQLSWKCTEYNALLDVGFQSGLWTFTNFTHWSLTFSFLGNVCIETFGVYELFVQLIPPGAPAAQVFPPCFFIVKCMSCTFPCAWCVNHVTSHA